MGKPKGKKSHKKKRPNIPRKPHDPVKARHNALTKIRVAVKTARLMEQAKVSRKVKLAGGKQSRLQNLEDKLNAIKEVDLDTLAILAAHKHLAIGPEDGKELPTILDPAQAALCKRLLEARPVEKIAEELGGRALGKKIAQVLAEQKSGGGRPFGRNRGAGGHAKSNGDGEAGQDSRAGADGGAQGDDDGSAAAQKPSGDYERVKTVSGERPLGSVRLARASEKQIMKGARQMARPEKKKKRGEAKKERKRSKWADRNARTDPRQAKKGKGVQKGKVGEASSKKGKKEDPASLHPSWQAKRKESEKVSSAKPSSSKKIVFAD